MKSLFILSSYVELLNATFKFFLSLYNSEYNGVRCITTFITSLMYIINNHFKKTKHNLTKSLKGCFSGISHSSLIVMYLEERFVWLHLVQVLSWLESPKLCSTIAALTYQSLWKGSLWRCAAYPACIHLHSSQHPLHETETCTPGKCTYDAGIQKYIHW